MRRPLIVAAVFLGATLPAAAKPGVLLAPHRVVYDLSLLKGGGVRGVEAARGRIAYDFTGNACEGYGLTYRQVTVLEGGETGAKTIDLRTTSFEDGKGESLRFKSESDVNGRRQDAVDGVASDGKEAIQVSRTQPKRDRLTLETALFPTEHMKRLIEAALAGETTLSARVYDGSDGGDKVYDTLAVIGRKIEPGAVEGVEEVSRREPLLSLSRWPVTLSYFQPGPGERTPVYVMSFELYENGFSRALRLDYGDFVLKGDVSSLDLKPVSDCKP